MDGLMQVKPVSKKVVVKSQLKVLLVLYRFRFGTTDLLARAVGLKDGRYIHTRLEALVNLGYIGKNYDSSYKLRGMPATYYLRSKSFPALKGRNNVSLKALRNVYKDKTASEEFIARNLAVFTAFDKLKPVYGKRLEFFCKSELRMEEDDYFPEPLPDAYITLMTSTRPKARARHYFLRYLDNNTPFFIHVRQLQKYLDYVEAEEWEDAQGTKLRGVLLVCESKALLKRIRKKLAQTVDDEDTPRFCFTTLQALKNSTIDDDEIWQMVSVPLEVFSLEDI